MTPKTRYVALLRGVNLGGRRRVSMSDLKVAVEEQGFSEVRTLIQSGNVVFSGSRGVAEIDLEAALTDRFGMTIEVMLRSARQMEKVVSANPFTDVDPRTVHVGYMKSAPAAADVRGMDVSDFEPERAAVVGAQVYFHLPNGMGRTKLPGYVARQLPIPTTVRNWNTTSRLLEMVKG